MSTIKITDIEQSDSGSGMNVISNAPGVCSVKDSYIGNIIIKDEFNIEDPFNVNVRVKEEQVTDTELVQIDRVKEEQVTDTELVEIDTMTLVANDVREDLMSATAIQDMLNASVVMMKDYLPHTDGNSLHSNMHEMNVKVKVKEELTELDQNDKTSVGSNGAREDSDLVSANGNRDGFGMLVDVTVKEEELTENQLDENDEEVVPTLLSASMGTMDSRDGKSLQCNPWQKQFVNHVDHDVKTHTYRCASCDKFVSTSQRDHTCERSFICDICGYSCLKSSFLARHRRHHFDSPVYKCDLCDKSFRYSRALHRHELRHVGKTEKPFKCSICGKSYILVNSLNKHYRSHGIADDHTYKCNVCDLTFSTLTCLHSHERTHNDRPFKCSVCGKSYNSSSDLLMHLRKHTGVTPLQCDLCSTSFKDSTCYIGHLKSHMIVEKPFQCKVSGETLNDSVYSVNQEAKLAVGSSPSRSLTSPTSTVHRPYYIRSVENVFKCSVCEKSFNSSGNLIAHIQSHAADKSMPCTVTFGVRPVDNAPDYQHFFGIKM